jgi:TetR/AcrR family transcriptional regulator, regulator of cefoperazone and chloramphenicol sensitivity
VRHELEIRPCIAVRLRFDPEAPVSPATRAAAGRAMDSPKLQESEPDTRQRLIDAAVECILEDGFYRASSNAIAERAGLSWGVIQYYFGSRESLLLTVLEEGTHLLVEELSTSQITGETLVDRIACYLGIVDRYYGDPRYLAYVQVMLNLSRDPKTSEQTKQTMLAISGQSEVQVRRLNNKLFSGVSIRNRSVRQLVFTVLRGVALSDSMTAALPFPTSALPSDRLTRHRLTAEALSLLVEQYSDT